MLSKKVRKYFQYTFLETDCAIKMWRQKSFKKCYLHENEAEYGKHKNKRTLTENESEISFDLLNQMT